MNGLKQSATNKRTGLSGKLAPFAILSISLLAASCGGPTLESTRAALGSEGSVSPTFVDYSNNNIAARSQAGALSSGRRVALVIGNGDYSQDIGALANPAKDAAGMAETLRRTGFEVRLLLNARRDEMQRAVLEFDQALRNSDVGLFYYAGHAVQVNGRNFMIPMGANLSISSSYADAVADYVALETLEIDNVLGRMGNAETDLSIVILDACRNNPFSGGGRGLSRGLAQTAAPRGSFIAYATSPGKIARDGSGQNSPYTSAIIKNLTTPGLKLEEVFKKVRQDVALQTNGEQIPWENSSVFGDFYFVEPAEKPEQPPARPTTAAPLERKDYIEVQRLLTRIGFYQGLITGEPDRETRDAIVRWQTLHGLELNGEISKAQLPFLRTDAARSEALTEAEERARREERARAEAQAREQENARLEAKAAEEKRIREQERARFEATNTRTDQFRDRETDNPVFAPKDGFLSREEENALEAARRQTEEEDEEFARMKADALARAEARKRAKREALISGEQNDDQRPEAPANSAPPAPEREWSDFIVPPPPA